MTKEFQHLENRIKEINLTFDTLLSSVDPLDQGVPKYQDIIKSYILLCHAEFEQYFEDVSKSVITQSMELYNTKQEIAKPLLYLVLMSDKSFSKDSEKSSNEDKPINYSNIVLPENRLKKIYSNYHSLLSQNHGIKKDNLFKMLTPIGVDILSLPETYIDQMESFGKKRGAIAHNGVQAISTNYNYSNEQKQIKILLDDTLKSVDSVLEHII